MALERSGRRQRVWLPTLPLAGFLGSFLNDWEVTDQIEQEDEDPDRIPGVETSIGSLVIASPRNPDAYPPRNILETIGSTIVTLAEAATNGNSLFALKMGLITCKGSVRRAS